MDLKTKTLAAPTTIPGSPEYQVELARLRLRLAAADLALPNFIKRRPLASVGIAAALGGLVGTNPGRSRGVIEYMLQNIPLLIQFLK